MAPLRSWGTFYLKLSLKCLLIFTLKKNCAENTDIKHLCFTDVLEVAETLNNVQLFSWNGSKESKIEKFGDGCLVNDIYSMIQDASPAIPTVTEKIGFHDKLLYIYTSGTTGLPKAAVITNAR